MNIYIVYEINKNFNISSYPALENCLFGTISLTKNVAIDKYKYSGYGIGFDRHGFFSHPGGRTGRNVSIFGADMSSSTMTDNMKKYILIFGKGPTQRLEHTMSAEKCIQSILPQKIKNSIWARVIMEQTVIYLLMVQKCTDLKQNILKL